MFYVGVFLISFLNTFVDPYAIKSSAYLKYIFLSFYLLNRVFTFYMSRLYCLLWLLFNSSSQNPIKHLESSSLFYRWGKDCESAFSEFNPRNLIPEFVLLTTLTLWGLMSLSSDNLYYFGPVKHFRLPQIAQGFPGGVSRKEPACQSRKHKRHRFNP